MSPAGWRHGISIDFLLGKGYVVVHSQGRMDGTYFHMAMLIRAPALSEVQGSGSVGPGPQLRGACLREGDLQALLTALVHRLV